MGIDTETARFLLSSHKAGARFARCLTLGRQNYFLSSRETRGLMVEFGLDPGRFPRLSEPYSRFRYAEPFWEALGVERLDAMDASKYEGANIEHDLNHPIPEEFRSRYDAVCDFGTLEHVFNLPVALRNCLDMVAHGGRFYCAAPANNFFGHGFYQFSPELFFRVLTARNGFEVERCIAVESGPRRRWFDVADPAEVRARAGLVNSYPVCLFVRARRVSREVVPVLEAHQSDCSAQWDGVASPQQDGVIDTLASDRFESGKRWLLEHSPRLARMLEAFRFSTLNPDWTFRNRKMFKPTKKV